MSSEFTMQQKIKVITKLTESGYDTEKKLQKLEMENILQNLGSTKEYKKRKAILLLMWWR